MKKMLIAVLIVTFCATTGYAQDKWDELLNESAKVFDEVNSMPDEGIPADLIEKCHAIAIFPSTLGAGFIVGGKYGQGVIIAHEEKSGNWSAPAVFTLAGGSIGFQIGGQASDIILLIMNERALDGILQTKFKLGADASVAAGPVGRDVEAATDLQMKGALFSYSRSRGAFAGVKVEGAVISFNEEGNTALYDDGITAQDILRKNKVSAPVSAKRLMETLSEYK